MNAIMIKMPILCILCGLLPSAEIWVCEVSSIKKNGMCQILAIDKNGTAKYFACIASDHRIISGTGCLNDNDLGPNLDKAAVEVTFGNFDIHIRSTSYGRSVIITQDGKLLSLDDMPNEFNKGQEDGYVKMYWIDDIAKLPKTKDAFRSHFIATDAPTP